MRLVGMAVCSSICVDSGVVGRTWNLIRIGVLLGDDDDKGCRAKKLRLYAKKCL